VGQANHYERLFKAMKFRHMALTVSGLRWMWRKFWFAMDVAQKGIRKDVLFRAEKDEEAATAGIKNKDGRWWPK
jgi:hypothetical protein